MGIQKVRENTINRWFYRIMSVLIFLFVMGLIYDPLGNQLNVFYWKTNNLLGDFFNVQIYIADWDPYYNTVDGMAEKCYPPLAYLFLEIFNGFYEYSGANLKECYVSTVAMMSGFMFALLSLALYFHSLSCLCDIPTKLKSVLFSSSIVLFSLERGNIIILCAAFICYYLAFKDSSDIIKRRFALICLCIASVIKIYPAIFGMFLLKEKRFKDIAFVFLLSCILFFTPFLCFEHGLLNFTQLLGNLKVFEEHYNSVLAARVIPRFSITDYPILLMDRLNIEYVLIYNLLRIIVMFLSLLTIFVFMHEKKLWRQYALLSMIVLYLPKHSVWYCGLYFIPVIVLFLHQKQFEKRDWIYMILFCILLNPLQIGGDNGLYSFTIVCSNIALIIIWFMLITDNIRMFHLCLKK